MKRFESMVAMSESRPSSASTTLASDLFSPTTRDGFTPQPVPQFVLPQHAFPGSEPQPICLMAPEGYEPNYAYPLFVWLHAPQGTEREVWGVMRSLSTRNYVAVGVRGPIHLETGYDWGDCEAESASTTEMAVDRVFHAVDRAVQQYNIREHRIFIAGFHRGGTMAARLALMYPERFAGAISVNGPLPEGNTLLRYWHSARGVKLLACMGRNSTDYSPRMLCEQLPLVHTAGLSLDVRQYPAENELTTIMLSDMNAWMMEQVATSVVV